MKYELHRHSFVSGPRSVSGYRKDGKWHDREEVKHSHAGGSIPHRHPDTGPSNGYRNTKLTSKPKGEQLELVPMSEQDSSFELIITDSALIHGKEPIGDTPIEALGFPAAERMMTNSRLRCIVRDERKGVQR